MVRVTNSVARHKRKKRIFKQAKGFVGDRKNHIRQAKGALMKAWAYAFRHRKQKKRDFRTLWIARINAASRVHGISYSKLINGLKKAEVLVNRKMLADLAINDTKGFTELVDQAKKALA